VSAAAAPMHGTAALTEVRLYGELGRRFGRVHRLAVGSIREAGQALAVIAPGFERFVLDYEPGFHCFVGDVGAEERGPEMLGAPVSASEAICIVPAVGGSKNNDGFTQVVIGVLLIAATVASSGSTTPYLSAFLASYGTQIGAALILGGTVQMLSSMKDERSSAAAESGSRNFSDAISVNPQGDPVPLTFGRCWVEGIVVSAGLLTEEMAVGAQPGDIGLHILPAEQPRDPLLTPEWTAPPGGDGGPSDPGGGDPGEGNPGESGQE